MKLYEIDQKIEEILNTMVDLETGEVNEEKMKELNDMQVERDTKLENIALYIKDQTAYIKALKEEKSTLADRQAVAEHKLERLKDYLAFALAGEKFKTPKVDISYRKSQAVNFTMDEGDVLETLKAVRPDLVKAEWKFDKTKIKDALKNNEQVYGAELKDNVSIQIK